MYFSPSRPNTIIETTKESPSNVCMTIDSQDRFFSFFELLFSDNAGERIRMVLAVVGTRLMAIDVSGGVSRNLPQPTTEYSPGNTRKYRKTTGFCALFSFFVCLLFCFVLFVLFVVNSGRGGP